MKLCPNNISISAWTEAKTLEERIHFFEIERDRVVAAEKSAEKKAEVQAFYDKIIAAWKKKGHICDYDPDNGFKCSTCGDQF